MKRYLFIDRDGTLIHEPPDQQIDSIGKFGLVPGVVTSLREFSSAGFSFVMVTNQDGLGTASYPREKFDMIQGLLLKILSSEGIGFEDILICPHASSQACLCRKPQTDLVRSYLASNEWDRRNSFVIGDRETDMILARNMGVKGILISPDYPWESIAHEILRRPRTARLHRKTTETDVETTVWLDGKGLIKIDTGIGFFDHMLEQLSRHGGFDLRLLAKGDLHIDEHHLVEDVALTLGAALKQALGEKRGIRRYGFWLPMDEATSRVTLDLSGRAHFTLKGGFPRSEVGGLSTEMISHFFRSLADSLAMSLHVEVSGENTHHMVESTFKAVGRSLRAAFLRGGDASVPSTKGSL